MKEKIRIAGTGCVLADFLYSGISFSSASFLQYHSRNTGDGGLSPGRLVFTEELERFAGKSYAGILNDITAGMTPQAFNVGGPGVVSLIHAAQLLGTEGFEVRFYGACGHDAVAERIRDGLRPTPMDSTNFRTVGNRPTPFTDVFSDPAYEHGQGERTFVNNIGAAWDYLPEMIDDSFFKADILCFGGTALVPRIHDELEMLLCKAKKAGAVTVVNTVYDFRNEKMNPGKPWQLGKNNESYQWIDVLIMDQEEALKISGAKEPDAAAKYFMKKGVSSFFITEGVKPVSLYSDGRLFSQREYTNYPVCMQVVNELKENPHLRGDTTGCGDNFAGGIIASLAWQLKCKSKGELDPTEALSWAVASGGFACYYLGGTYQEEKPFGKYEKVSPLFHAHQKQISTNNESR